MPTRRSIAAAADSFHRRSSSCRSSMARLSARWPIKVLDPPFTGSDRGILCTSDPRQQGSADVLERVAAVGAAVPCDGVRHCGTNRLFPPSLDRPDRGARLLQTRPLLSVTGAPDW